MANMGSGSGFQDRREAGPPLRSSLRRGGRHQPNHPRRAPERPRFGWLLLLCAALLGTLGLPPAPFVHADATSTSFSPTSVTLASNGSSATITVSAVGVDAGVTGVQLNIQHPPALSVTNPQCVGIFMGAVVIGPVATDGGTLINCVLFPGSGAISGPTGNVMTFELTRLSPGDATISFGASGALRTQYSKAGTGVGPGALNTLQVSGSGVPVPTATVTQVVPTAQPSPTNTPPGAASATATQPAGSTAIATATTSSGATATATSGAGATATATTAAGTTATATSPAEATATSTATGTPATATPTPVPGSPTATATAAPRRPAGNLAFITPVRVVDTRAGAQGITTTGFDGNGNPIGPGPLTPNQIRQFRIGGKSFGTVSFPDDTTGLLLNVTIVGPAGGGFVTVFPGDLTAPPNASTVNPSTEIAANFWATGVPATGASRGSVGVFSTVPADLILDVVGFYSPSNPAPPAGPGGLVFIPPTRVIDTRPSGNGIVTTGFDQSGNAIAPDPLQPNAPRRFRLAGQTSGGGAISFGNVTFPNDLSGVIAHVTIIQDAPSGGYVAVYPGDQATPPHVSTVNPSTAIAFNTTALGIPGPVGGAHGQDAGTLTILSTNATHVAVDIVGYFAPSNGAGAGSLNFVPPTRVIDTRPNDPPAGIATTGFTPAGAPIAAGPVTPDAVRRFGIAGRTFSGLNVPADARSVLLNVTIIGPGPSGGYLIAFPGDVPDAQRPNASTVNPSTAIAASFWANGLPVLPAANAGSEAIYTTTPLDVAVDIVGYFK